MKKLIALLFTLFTLTSYSQKEDNDDVYWTVYDTDTVEEETSTYVTNNYYTDYTSRIYRFHRSPYYTSYWSYYNPYWYSYYYPFYTSYYWWSYRPFWSYYGFNNHHHHYSHWYSYYPTHHYAYHKKSNIDKKKVVYKPKKIVKKLKDIKRPVYQTYTKPKSIVKEHPTYHKPKQVKYIHIEPVRIHKHTKTITTYNKQKSIQRQNIRNVNVKPSKIQHTRKAIK